jgi:hypothetical protein
LVELIAATDDVAIALLALIEHDVSTAIAGEHRHATELGEPAITDFCASAEAQLLLIRSV